MARDYELILSLGDRTYRCRGWREPRDGDLWLHTDCYVVTQKNDPTPISERPKRFILQELHICDAILAGTEPASQNPSNEEQS